MKWDAVAVDGAAMGEVNGISFNGGTDATHPRTGNCRLALTTACVANVRKQAENGSRLLLAPWGPPVDDVTI
jgi:hypothetical protein